METKTERLPFSRQSLEAALSLGGNCGLRELQLLQQGCRVLEERGIRHAAEVRECVWRAKQLEAAAFLEDEEGDIAAEHFGRSYQKILDIHQREGAAALTPFAAIILHLTDLQGLIPERTTLPSEKRVAFASKIESAFRLYVTLPGRLEAAPREAGAA